MISHRNSILVAFISVVSFSMLGSDSLTNKITFSFGVETKTFWRNFHKNSTFPIMPLIPTLEIGKKLNSTQAIAFSVGYSLPVNIGSETNYAFLYRINALFVSAGINQAILSKNRIRINVSMLGIGRVGSVRWNTDVYSYLPPPPEFDEAIPDGYRIDGIGLGFRASFLWFLSASQRTGIMLEYGLDKYLLGISTHRYSFNETIALRLVLAF